MELTNSQLHIEAKKVEKFLEKDLETMLQVLEEIKDEQDEVIFDHIKVANFKILVFYLKY